jgi:biopolymer transport protein ExbB/biopolymer transport protein TolQ
MSGIAEALVATGVGLLVALPSVAMYNVLIRHVETATAGAEAMSREVIAYLKTPAPGGASGQGAA